MKLDKGRLSFRRATLTDVELLINFRIIFLKEAQERFSGDNELVLRQTLKQYFSNSLKDNSFVSWIAEYENDPVGFSGMVIRNQPGNFELPTGLTGYILNMFTLQEFRKNGIGSFLFQKLLDEAKLRRLDKVELHATKDGEHIYRIFGFIEPHDLMLEKILS